MAAPGFVLRLRTPQGMKRLNFSSNQDTFATLQQQVQLATGVPPQEQGISTTELKSPNFLQGPPSKKLADFRLNHGDILYMVDAPSSVAKPPAATAAAKPSVATPAPSSSSAHKPPPPVQLSKLCQHGPRGRCVHCDGVPVGVATPVKVQCNHGPNAVCPNCSAYVQDKSRPKDEVAPWLCNHPDTAFCPKCIPKEPVGDDGKVVSNLKGSCNKAKGQQCLICMDKGPVIKVNFLPFAMYLEERRGMCKFAHPANQVCASCAPPKIEDYKGKANCDRGHKPWPYGVCLNCAPANANIRLQKFRHCDTVSFEDVRALQRFYSDYMKKGAENERAGVLFGTYTNEPPTTQLHGAIRAQVQAVYQPPQEAIPKGMRFLRDPNEEHVHKVATALGLQPVGWVVATFPRSGPKYGGQVFMSGLEIKQAARFQNRYKHSEQGYSRFVTVVVECAENVAPEAYQVSDQCVALERDGVLAMAPDAYMLATHAPQKGEIVPSVVYKDKPLVPGVEFVPDEFIVKVIVTQPEAPRPLLRYNEFPSNGTEADARGYFTKHAKEAYHIKLSDFNLLVFLSSAIGLQVTAEACAALLTGTPFPDSLKNNLDKSLAAKKLI